MKVLSVRVLMTVIDEGVFFEIGGQVVVKLVDRTWVVCVGKEQRGGSTELDVALKQAAKVAEELMG